PKTDTLFVEVLDSTAPEFEVIKCEDSTVEVIVTDDNYPSYAVLLEEGNEVITDGSSSVPYRYSTPGLKTIRVEGVYEDATRNCGVTTQTVDVGEFTNNGRITGLRLSRSCLTSVDATVFLDWDPQQRYELQYSVGRTAAPITVFSGQITSDSLFFPTLTTDTENDICFRLNALSTCNEAVIEGGNVCRDNPNAVDAAIENAYATYEGGDIALYFDEIAIGGFEGEREVLGFDPEPLDTLFPGFVDRNVSPFREYIYRIGFSDTCGNVVPPAEILTSFVQSRETRINQQLVTWKAAENQLASNFLQQVVVVGAGQEKTISNPDNPVEVFLEEPLGPRQEILLRTIYADGTIIESNRVPVDYEYRAYLPDAFTPNGDFLNDELRLIGLTNEAINWKIYNRWGEVVFTSQSAEVGWDGTYRGSRAPGGVYFYDLTFLNSENETIRQTGSFVLIRN
ncbi:MAG: gliding motility-associated C-terminal domain-containing protein, partial [Bacteroidota bacterium]